MEVWKNGSVEVLYSLKQSELYRINRDTYSN